MVENGADAKPSDEQIDAWVATFTTYTTKQMKQIVSTERFRLKPEGGWDKAAAPPRRMNDAHRAVHLW